VNPPRERIPIAVLLTAAALLIVHLFLALFSEPKWGEALLVFAFIPARYDSLFLSTEPWWIGWGPAVWTFVTYAFIHGNFLHLIFNLVWLLAFGTPVARRFGSLRFAIFFVAAAVTGAAFHLVLHFDQSYPVIGASAAISGMMGAAIRFVFQRGGPLARGEEPGSYQIPALPLPHILRDPRVLVFLLMWFGLNFLFGEFSAALPGVGENNIAWEAHIGGFLAGLLGFGLFDPVSAPNHTPPPQNGAQPTNNAASSIVEALRSAN
jgi:membrane associated rhomboid family serine protease